KRRRRNTDVDLRRVERSLGRRNGREQTVTGRRSVPAMRRRNGSGPSTRSDRDRRHERTEPPGSSGLGAFVPPPGGRESEKVRRDPSVCAMRLSGALSDGGRRRRRRAPGWRELGYRRRRGIGRPDVRRGGGRARRRDRRARDEFGGARTTAVADRERGARGE